jgi:hypothetical protein
MRRLGLTLCLLVSSLGARAAAAEDRVAELEARVKALESALGASVAPGAIPEKAEGAYETGGSRVIPSTDGQSGPTPH